MDPVFHRNILRRFKDIVVYVELASQKGISNRVKSAHYRAAIIVAATIVEGMVYELIVKETGDRNPIILTDTERRVRHRLPSAAFGTTGFTICEDILKEIRLMDRQCTFRMMNKYCRDEGIVSLREFKRLEYVREKRNSLHVQSLISDDRGYTSKTLNLIGLAVDFLMTKLLRP